MVSLDSVDLLESGTMSKSHDVFRTIVKENGHLYRAVYEQAVHIQQATKDKVATSEPELNRDALMKLNVVEKK